ILRRIDSPQAGHEPAYEIFHDVLARVILVRVDALEVERERQKAEVAKREAENVRKRVGLQRRLLIVMTTALAVTALLLAWAVMQTWVARRQTGIAVDATRTAKAA